MTYKYTRLFASFCITAGGTSVERRQSNLQNSGALPGRPHDIKGAISAVLLALFLAGAATALADDLYLNLAQVTHATCGWGTARNDASVAGQPLRVGTAEFENGVGTHAPAELVYRLDGKYRWLTFYAGVSADMTEQGSVTVEVWLDGKKTFDTGVLRVREEPRYVSLPVAGVKELRIVGTDAGDGIAADHLNLCKLRLSTDTHAPQPDGAVFVGKAPAPTQPLALWYRRPAQRWLEALPVGNGRLGAMVFGGVRREKLALNESTLWSGAPSDSNVNPAGLQHLPEIRRLLFAGQYNEARALCGHLLGRKNSYPKLKEAAEFFLDYLAEDPQTGYLLTGPAVSPENSFVAPVVDTYRRNWDGDGTTFFGTKGWISLSRSSYAASNPEWFRVTQKEGAKRLPYEKNYYGAFVDAVREHKPSVAPIRDAVRSDALSHLSVLAIQSGSEIVWDPKAYQIQSPAELKSKISHEIRGSWQQS